MRILEIGCGPGVAAREIVSRFKDIYVLGIDRSEKAIHQAIKSSATEIKQGKLKFVKSKIEDFELPEGEEFFDIVFAVRVGALDGRHPEMERIALEKIEKVMGKKGRLFIEKNEILIETSLKK